MGEIVRREQPKRARPVVRSVLAVVVLAALAFFAWQYFTRPEAGAADASAQVVARVGKIMLLPNGTPTVTTVDKPSELQKQAFFAKVQKGDKVLIYPQSRKIIIYRPGSNQIVNTGPILDDAMLQSSSQKQ